MKLSSMSKNDLEISLLLKKDGILLGFVPEIKKNDMKAMSRLLA